MRISDKIACSFDQWYPTFSKVTFESKVIPLSGAFVDYLKSDNFVLPESCNEELDQQWNSVNEGDESCENVYVVEEFECCTLEDAQQDNPPADQKVCFPEIEAFIRQTLNEFGSVFPKLNWSSPKDASWISSLPGMKCQSCVDVFLLLKSSNSIAADLSKRFDEDRSENDATKQFEYIMVLKKWHDLLSFGEFRCFVKEKKLVGICQRRCEEFCDYSDSDITQICSDIGAFYEKYVSTGFPLDSFVFDVYIEKEMIYIVDFGIYGSETDAILFNWNELDSSEVLDRPLFRCIRSASECWQPSTVPCGLPLDASDPYLCQLAVQKYNAHQTKGCESDDDSVS